MDEPDNPHPNGRTHEPNLRELTAELDGLKELLLAKLDAVKELFNERDKLYKERDDSRKTAVDAALTAVKEQTKASFDGSEKAIVKAEESQRQYNQGHNDLSRKMEGQYKDMLPRPEADAKFKATEEKIEGIKKEIASLRESRSEGTGEKGGRLSSQQLLMMIVSLILALVVIGGAAVGIVIAIQK